VRRLDVALGFCRLTRLSSELGNQRSRSYHPETDNYGDKYLPVHDLHCGVFHWLLACLAFVPATVEVLLVNLTRSHIKNYCHPERSEGSLRGHRIAERFLVADSSE
jgi:hypothetical protein